MTTQQKLVGYSLLSLTSVLGLTGCGGVAPVEPVVYEDVVYLPFGDSTTAGPSTRDYPDILREKIGAAVETFTNEGQGGETTDEGLERLRELIDMGTCPNAEVLLYWEGGNDITDFIGDHDPLLVWSPMDEDYLFTDSLTRDLDDIQANVEDAIHAGQEEGMSVYVATYYLITDAQEDCSALPLDTISAEQAARASDYVVLLNERIRAAAETTGAVLVDVETLDGTLRSDPDNYINCNHLSAKGNEIVANFFADRLEEFGDATLSGRGS